MTIGTGDQVLAADVNAVAAAAASALTAAAAAAANAATALSNSEAAQATAADAVTTAGAALSIAALPLAYSVANADLVPIAHSGTNYAVTATTFTAGLSASIASVGSVAASALSLAEGALSIPALPVVTSVGAADLVPIAQSGTSVAASVQNFLGAETIDQLSAAGAASDTDTFLTGQGGSNVLTVQSNAALWTWLSTQHLPGYKPPVQEIAAGPLAVDGTYNGKILVVTGAGVVINPNYTLMGNGFACQVVTSGTGTVVWGAGVTATNGAAGLPVSSQASLLAYTSSAGNVVMAAVAAASGSGVSVPGSISGLTVGSATSTTLSASWSAPGSGGTATYYQPQYRVTSVGGAWTAAPGTAILSATLNGLAPSTEYDVQVAAGNSAGLSAYSATVTGTTSAAGIAAPGTPTALAATSETTTTVSLGWTAPGSGGAVATYTVQYRVTSVGGSWTQITGITGTSTTVTGLTADTGYDFQVAAVNAGGSSSFTATTTQSTASAPSTTAAWANYHTALTHGTSGNIFNLQITSGTAPTSVAIGFSTSQTVAPNPMPATIDGFCNNFNGNFWGTYMNAPATTGTWYGWGIGYDGSGNPLFTIVGAAITVS